MMIKMRKKFNDYISKIPYISNVLTRNINNDLRAGLVVLAAISNPIYSSAEPVDKPEKITITTILDEFDPFYRSFNLNDSGTTHLAWEATLHNGIDDLERPEKSDDEFYNLMYQPVEDGTGNRYETGRLEIKTRKYNNKKITKTELTQVVLESETPIKGSDLTAPSLSNETVGLRNHGKYTRKIEKITSIEKNSSNVYTVSFQIDNLYDDDNLTPYSSCLVSYIVDGSSAGIKLNTSGNITETECLDLLSRDLNIDDSGEYKNLKENNPLTKLMIDKLNLELETFNHFRENFVTASNKRINDKDWINDVLKKIRKYKNIK